MAAGKPTGRDGPVLCFPMYAHKSIYAIDATSHTPQHIGKDAINQHSHSQGLTAICAQTDFTPWQCTAST